MAVVAVAGGTSGLGRSIVEDLINQGKHEVLILGRKKSPDLEAAVGVPVTVIDYKNRSSIKSTLEAHNVETVICTINSQVDLEPELNLILAADWSQITRRFIPSIFAGFPYPVRYPDSTPVAKAKSEVLKAVKKTSLEYTAFYNGIFLDYYGAPGLKSNVSPWPLFVDILNERAAVPGSGDIPVVFTHSSDIAKFVVASLDLTNWREESFILGEKLTWHEFIGLAEDAKGSKFNVVHDSEADLNAGNITILPSYPKMFQLPEAEIQTVLAPAGIWFLNRELDLNPTYTLNSEFPDITPVSVKEFLNLSWARSAAATSPDIKI